MQEFETEVSPLGPSGRSEKKRPRKISPARLEHIALHYLGRYASSAAHLCEVLRRRAQRGAEFHEQDMREVAAWIDALVERFVEKGYVNDRNFSESEIRRLRRKGSSTARMRAHLRNKGVPVELIQELLAGGDVDEERQAAHAFARRRGLGPYRMDPEQRAQSRMKDLAAMARAGFDRDAAENAIDATSPDD